MIRKKHKSWVSEVVPGQVGGVEQVCTCWRSLIWMELPFHSCKYSTIIFTERLTTSDHVSYTTQDPWKKESKPRILKHCQYRCNLVIFTGFSSNDSVKKESVFRRNNDHIQYIIYSKRLWIQRITAAPPENIVSTT